MYKVSRNGGRTVITDWNGTIIFSTENDALVIYRDHSGIQFTAKVEELNDIQLLTALAGAVKLAL